MYIAGDKAISIHGYVISDKGSIAFSSGGDLPGSIKLTDMPRCLTVSDDGKIYVGMTNYVEVYDSRGKQLASWDSLGERAVLTSIAVSKNGPEQLVEGGAPHVSELSAGSQAGGFDVAVDAQERIFILDTINNVVKMFTRKAG